MYKLCLILLFSSVISISAHAHKVVASAWTDGADIEGEVGFSNGDMALNGTLIEVFNKEGNKIGETKILEDGLFRFTPRQAISHRFFANLGAGHVANVTLETDELPDHIKTQVPSKNPQAAPLPASTAQPSLSDSAIARLVAKAVRKEVQPLRKEIASYKEKNDLQSILGGIGYIFGLTGLVFYIAARRKESQKS